MARIVLGIGCSHAPQLHTPVEHRDQHARRDTEDGTPLWYKGERIEYTELLERRRGHNFGEQLDPQLCDERLKKARDAIRQLSEIFAEAWPDITIIFGNDQGEMFLDDARPAFSILGCEQFGIRQRTGEQLARLPTDPDIVNKGRLPGHEKKVFPVHPVLARYPAQSAEYCALRDSSLKCHHVDYQPLYRTPAGTGSSAAFMYWKM